jgi:DNA-binding PadR family transcriptional regulator
LESKTSLTATSYIVLGLLERSGRATPYELKQAVAASIGNFWSVPHSQLYAEPDRLAAAGYVTVEREQSGRRRKSYELTDLGRSALERWREEVTAEPPEIRDTALLKLFFDADPGPLAAIQVEAHRAKLAEYEALLAADDGSGPRGGWRALQAGIGHEREWVRYWEGLVD